MPRRPAVSCTGRAVAFLAVALLVLPNPVRAEPAKPVKSAKSPAAVRPAPASPPRAPSGPREFADAYPSALPAAEDLHLLRAGDRRAEALAQFARGMILEDNAENDAALACFRRAFELDATNAELAVKLAYLLAQRSDATGGIEVLKDAIKASPRETLPLIYLSQLYAKYLKKPESGIKYAEQALALDDGSYQAYLALFELFSATGQSARIDGLLERAAKSSTTNAQFWLQIAGLHQQVYGREIGAAIAPDKLAIVNALFRKAAAYGKDDALILARVGNYFIDTKQVSESIPFYQKALSLKQTSDDPVLANAGDKLAVALREAGQLDNAIAVLEKVTKENPLRSETFELMGSLYIKKGDLARAIESYKLGLLLDRNDAQSHLRLIQIEIEAKRFADAIGSAKAGLRSFPDHPQMTYMLAIALSQAKRHTEAMTVFAEALADYEECHPEFLTGQFYFSYGAAADQAGLGEKAEELLKKAIEVDPPMAAQAYNYLGYMWTERGEKLEEAGEMIQKALELEPDNGAFLDSLGWLLFKKGEYDKALTQLLKAAEAIHPEDSVVLDHVGDAYQQLGKAAQALQYWQKALALDGENRAISDKIEGSKEKVSSNTAVKPPVAPVPEQ